MSRREGIIAGENSRRTGDSTVRTISATQSQNSVVNPEANTPVQTLLPNAAENPKTFERMFAEIKGETINGLINGVRNGDGFSWGCAICGYSIKGLFLVLALVVASSLLVSN